MNTQNSVHLNMHMYFLIWMISAGISSTALAQKEYQYKNDFSTGEEASRRFGIPQNHNRSDPKLEAGEFKFELGNKLECGNIDIKANIKGQFNELQKQLEELVPKTPGAALELAKTGAFITTCYAYPTICAQLRHDWLSIQGKLNLRAQACAAVDKFIDNQAEKGSRQLRSEAVAKCVHDRAGNSGDVASALKSCQEDQGNTRLPMRDFQTGLMRSFGNEKQKVLKSMLSFAKDDTAYEFLSGFLGEIQVGSEGGWEPLFEKGIVRPADVADTFLSKGQSLVCNRIPEILAGRYVASGVYEDAVVAVVKRKLNAQVTRDLSDLPAADKDIACLALGRAVGKEAALKASSRYESVVSTGLLNTAIPEPLRAEYRDRSLSAFPAMRLALEGESIPPVEAVRSEIAAFARLQRTKTTILASETNRAKLKNIMGDKQSATECADSLSCQ
jgi:hypothetical protein